jgi:hypothetical protein
MTLFMGSGEHTKHQVARLHTLLDEALRVLGELQQAPQPECEPTANEIRVQQSMHEADQYTMRLAVTEIAKALGQETLLTDGLISLLTVPNKYNQAPQQVGLSLDHRGGSWTLTRDDEAGGGPWRRGPKGKTPAEAVAGFEQMVRAGDWSAKETS